MKKKINVAVIFGGRSGEHEVSIVSALSIYKTLDRDKYDVTMIGIAQDGRWLLPDESELLANQSNPRLIHLEKQKKEVALLPHQSSGANILMPVQAATASVSAAVPGTKSIDVIFPVLHGTNGEDGTIQGMLELAQIPYVGSGVMGSAVGMDKDMTKRVLKEAGIPIVPFQVVRKHEWLQQPNEILSRMNFPYPVFVKPANMGSSVGINKVKTPDQLKSALDDAFQYDVKALIEIGIDARELEIAVLGNDQPKASTVGEIKPNHEFYSYEAKYIDENGADFFIPAKDLSDAEIRDIQNMAVKAFTALECAGMARVDFFLDRKTRKVYLNELNTIPGFTPISMYPKLWAASGIPYPKLLDRLIELAIERNTLKTQLKTTFKT